MAYEKNTWSCGDDITADKLNNIEDGIEEALACCGGSQFALVRLTEESATQYVITCASEKSMAEMVEMYNNGTVPILLLDSCSDSRATGLYFPSDFVRINGELTNIHFTTTARTYGIPDEGDTLYVLAEYYAVENYPSGIYITKYNKYL